MITIKNARLIDKSLKNFSIPSTTDQEIDVEGKLTLIPALIDPHVHFRTPGHEDKENLISGAAAAIAGGVTTVLDMPNNTPPCTTKKAFEEKRERVNRQLEEVKIPLRVFYYFGADEKSLNDIPLVKKEIVGIKVYMGSSTGGLVMNDKKSLEKVFQIAAQENLILTVHAEDEAIMEHNKAKAKKPLQMSDHSKIRSPEAALAAVKEAIDLAEKYSAQVYIAHVSTKLEIDYIREAKKKHLIVYAEATPHHLFLTETDVAKWGCKVKMNPPLRTAEDQEALWLGIKDGTIDTIGSDHAPHTLEEKGQPYEKAPAGVPGIETTLPLLLTASKRGLLSIEKMVQLTRQNPERIFRLPATRDAVLVDMETERVVEDRFLKTKCGWSPFAGRALIGWPIYTILGERVYRIER